MKCPNPACGATLSEGDAVCWACGGDIAAPAAPAPAFAPASEDSTSGCDGDGPTGEGAIADRLTEDVSDGRPFMLSVALPQAMQVGRRSSVKVRFKAVGDIYESVRFVLCRGGEALAEAECSCGGRPLAESHEADLSVMPRTPGEASLKLRVVCGVAGAGGGETEIWETADFPLYVEEADKGPAAFSPVFNISQSQTADRAGDSRGGAINVNVNGADLRAASASSSVDASRYSADRRSFKSQAPKLVASPSRLTLRAEDGAVLQLLSDCKVVFGRSSATDVPLRICAPGGAVDRAANIGNISRFHFSVACDGRDCRVSDGDGSTPSTYGTRIDGRGLGPGGSCRLPPGRTALLGAGRPGRELALRVVFCLDGAGRPAGFEAVRCDGARQRILCVWRGMPAGGGASVSWTGKAWIAARGGGVRFPLAVGSHVALGGAKYVVCPYVKTHLR